MRKYDRFLYLLAVIKIVIPYLLQNHVYEPHRDEFLYLAEGHHLAWGFMEVPPMLSIFAWLTHVLGDGMFWIKLWPSLFGAAVFIVSGKIILSLGGRHFALILLFFAFIFGAYLRVFFLFQPNPPEILAWTMIAYCFIRYSQTGNNKWLYIFGISVGLGMLSKYSVAFYTVSILAGLACTRQRAVFLNKHFWLACLLALFIMLPNIIWQYTHSLPVIHHMKELQAEQLKYINPISFLIDQLLMNLPSVFTWLAGLVYVLVSKENRYRFIGFAYIFVIALLLAGHGKNYYALGAYPPLLAFGAFSLEQLTRVKRKALRYIFLLIPIVVGLLFLPIALPILPPQQLAKLYVRMNTEKTGALKWEDQRNHPLAQDFSDMLGWEEMTQKAAKAYETLSNTEMKNTLIFCDNYGMAAAINYYAPKYNLPPAYSDNASFLYWIPDTLHFTILLLVTSDHNELQHDFAKDFQSVKITDSVTNEYAREKGDWIYLFKGADTSFSNYFTGKLKKDRDAFKY